MALADLDSLKIHLSITGTTQDALLTQILGGVDRAIRSYTSRRLELATRTEYYSGQNRAELVLRDWPVWDDDQLTVHLDASGYFGKKANAFPTESLLVSGTDYALQLDGPDGFEGQDELGSASGILVRLGLGNNIGDAFRRYSVVAGYIVTSWPIGQGNIKVTYTSGYDPIPDDLSLAAMQMSAIIYRTRLYGGVRLGAETLGKYSYSLLSGQQNVGADGEMGSVRQLLAPYVRREGAW